MRELDISNKQKIGISQKEKDEHLNYSKTLNSVTAVISKEGREESIVQLSEVDIIGDIDKLLKVMRALENIYKEILNEGEFKGKTQEEVLDITSQVKFYQLMEQRYETLGGNDLFKENEEGMYLEVFFDFWKQKKDSGMINQLRMLLPQVAMFYIKQKGARGRRKDDV